MQKIVMLDNIRSRYNVGAIFRTADGVGVEKVYLLGSTPSPIDRFGREDEKIAKTSLGATKSVVWEHVGASDTLSTAAGVAVVKQLQPAGWMVVAVEQASCSSLLSDCVPSEKVAYVLGAEVTGVQPELVAAADKVVELPMLGQKESLNVSVAAGIVLYKGLV
jgi:23S rRNA (guanosine2251-2'-O)-methyltransferase